MKVAIFEPDPRVCGPLSWGGHMKEGFRRLGIEAVTFSATKSGKTHSHWGNVKPGGKWWTTAPDRVEKIANAPAALREYDLVILPEPKSPLADKTVLKEGTGELPWYITVLRDSGVRFITALHGNPYNEKNSPFAHEVLALDNFCGTIIGHTAPLRTVSDAIAEHRQIELALPYAAKTEIDAPFTRSKTVGTSGRFMFNKGSHVTGLAGQYLDEDATVEIWGSCSAGRGPSLTFNLYEELKPLTTQGKYKRFHTSDMSHPRATEDGNVVHPFPWEVTPDGGAKVSYMGNYTDPVATVARFMVHVNLTSAKYTSGMEFSTLEALDAGNLCITPPHCSQPEYYRTLVLDGWFAPAGSVGSAIKDPEPTKRVAAAIESAFTFLDRPYEEHRDLVIANREAIRKYADPAAVAQGFLDAAATH